MNAFLREGSRERILKSLIGLMVPGGPVSLAETVPRHAQRLSELLSDKESGLIDSFRRAEEKVYNGGFPGMTDWDEGDIAQDMADAGFKNTRVQLEHFTEARIITGKDLTSWFGPSSGGGIGYGDIVRKYMGDEDTAKIKELIAKLCGRPIDWRRTVAFVTASS